MICYYPLSIFHRYVIERYPYIDEQRVAIWGKVSGMFDIIKHIIETKTMPPGCCPCAPNSIISLQFWKTYTGCLLSQESNTRCCCSLVKLCMVKLLHISSSYCLCFLQPGPCDQRTKISSEYQDALWKGLVDATLRMPLAPFGNISQHLLNVPLYTYLQEQTEDLPI